MRLHVPRPGPGDEPPASGSAPGLRSGRPRGRNRRTDGLIAGGLFVLAVAVRLGVVWSSGGFKALNGYDDGVYFSATAGLLHGLVPYRDFVLLHPPGILVRGAGPIALAQALDLSDSDALVLVRMLFVGLGGLNTVLVFLAGRHLSRTAGVVAGCLYAVWGPAIREERTMLLEAMVILGTLTALVLVPAVSTRSVTGRWRPLLAGLVGGLAVATKLWSVVPILVIFGSLLVARHWRRALAYGATAAMTALAVAAPFLVLAPSQMWHMVVTSQVGRPERDGSRLARFVQIGDLTAWPLSALANPTLPTRPVSVAAAYDSFFAAGRGPEVTAAVVLLATLVAILVALRLPPARTWVVLVAVQSGVLLATPVFFSGYASFVAPAGVLLVGAAGHLVWTGRAVRGRPRLRNVVGVAAALALALMAWGAVLTDQGAAIRPPLTPLVASARCVASDSPAAIVLADRLSANLAHDCPPVFDFSGVVYTFGREGSGPVGPSRLREESQQFQRFVQDYFGQADFVILRRRTMTGISSQTMATLQGRPLIRSRSPRVYGPPGSAAPNDQTPVDPGSEDVDD